MFLYLTMLGHFGTAAMISLAASELLLIIGNSLCTLLFQLLLHELLSLPSQLLHDIIDLPLLLNELNLLLLQELLLLSDNLFPLRQLLFSFAYLLFFLLEQ